MSTLDLLGLLRPRYQRRMAKWLGRKPYEMPKGRPLVSFTFDDVPRSSITSGVPILENAGVAGTFFLSLGLMGQTGPTGEIFTRSDLELLAARRHHEIGCHTFHHHPAWETRCAKYLSSVSLNAVAIAEATGVDKLTTHSYPISYPRPTTKHRLAGRFRACRGGGQNINRGRIDLNYLNSYFLEQSGNDISRIKKVIDENASAGGWLIFSTHDVCKRPTKYGCVPSLLEATIQLSLRSGAKICVMSSALETIGAPSS